jgi:hypothetical protein
MADEQDTEQAEAPKSKAGGGLMGKLIVAGFMGAVIATECLLAYLFIPNPDEVAALAEENVTKKLPASLAGDEVTSEDDRKNMVEIQLGDYAITISQRNSSTALRADFTLAGTVLSKDENEFANLMEKHPARFREIVLYEFRNSEREDLDDPQLGLIKRRILERSNTLFGKPIIKKLMFPDFSYIEQ